MSLPSWWESESPMIDWFTIGAQILNFVILVWLMKRYLYKPILGAIDAREQRIAAELANAAAKQLEADMQRDNFRRKNNEFDKEHAVMLNKAADEAAVERKRLFGEAQKAADALTAQRKQALAKEAQSLHQEINRRTQQEVFAIARKALGDLANTGLEASMAKVFCQRIRAMNDPAKSSLAAAFEGMSEPTTVRSAFNLPADQRGDIQHAVNEAFSADISLRFETQPDLVSGIELTANGQKVAWSLADYLDSMQQQVDDFVGLPVVATPEQGLETAST